MIKIAVTTLIIGLLSNYSGLNENGSPNPKSDIVHLFSHVANGKQINGKRPGKKNSNRNSLPSNRRPKTSNEPIHKKVSSKSRSKDLVHRMPARVPGINGHISGMSFNTHTAKNANHTFLRAELGGISRSKMRAIIKRDIIKRSRRLPHITQGQKTRRIIQIGKQSYNYSLYLHPDSKTLIVGSIAPGEKAPNKKAEKRKRKKIRDRFKINGKDITLKNKNI